MTRRTLDGFFNWKTSGIFFFGPPNVAEAIVQESRKHLNRFAPAPFLFEIADSG